MRHVKVTSKRLPNMAAGPLCNMCFYFKSLFMSDMDAWDKCVDKGVCFY